jgi:hypothetical protein
MGGAPFYGSEASGDNAGYTFVAIASTPDAGGYWLVRNDGAIYAYGDAEYEGDLPSLPVSVTNIVGIATTTDSDGYWLVGSDGGVYAFGDAGFEGSGSYGGQFTTSGIVGIASTPDANGYWLVRNDGLLLAFGDAAFLGSEEGVTLGGPIVGMIQ